MRKINILLALLVLPFIALAQDNEEKEDVSKTVDLTEVTITAEKVESKLQETPVAVSIIEVEKIENENITTLADLSSKIPNFFVLDYGSKLSPPVFMRGMGLRRDASPSVGLYVDNVPYLEKGSFNFDFVDIENIEVLRGPQGTLYGRNTMGGLIKIYTQDPKALLSTYLKTDFGNYGTKKVHFHLNAPLSKKFYTVSNFMYSRGDGFFKNAFTDEEADSYETYAGRFKIAYRPNENFKATLSADYESSKQLGFPYAIYDVSTQTANEVNYNRESNYNRDQLSIGLNIEHIANKFILSYSTSYQLLDDAFLLDQDFSPTDIYYINQDRLHHTIYQELNIHSKEGSEIDWLVGLMYFKQFTDKDVRVNFGTPYLQMTHSPLDSRYYIKNYDQPTNGFALYSQATYHLWDFDITGGLRMDFEKAELEHTYTEYPNGIAENRPGFDSDLKYSQLIPKFSIAYKPCDYFTTFFSITKGYKAGGFNSSFETDEARTFDPEYSWNYELGFKSSWFKKHLTANLSLFLIDIEDQQVLQSLTTGQGAYVINAGMSRSKGIELELNGVINKNWQVWSAFGFNEAKFREYTNAAGDDLRNNHIPNVPEFTFSAGTNFTFELNGYFVEKMHVNLSYQHFGKQYWEEENLAYQKSYGLTNGKITFESKHYDFGFWSKNLFNVDYHAFYFTSRGTSYVQLGKPAQFGVFVKIKL